MAVTIVGDNTPTAGGVGYGTGVNLAFTTAGTSGQVLTSAGAGAPTWAGINVSTGVTGVLPVANGGTNSTATPTAGGVGYGTGTAHAYTTAGSAGGVLYSTGSTAPSFTAAGTSGQVLTSAGAGAPTWTTPSAGALTLVSSTSISSGAANVTFTGLNFSTYKAYVVEILSVINSSSTIFSIQVSTDNGSTWKTSGYLSSLSYVYNVAGGGSSSNFAISTSYFQIGSGSGSAAYPISARVELPGPNPATASGFATVMYQMVNANPSGPDVINYFGGGFNTSGYGNYNAIKVFPSSGTMSSGTINLYGLT